MHGSPYAYFRLLADPFAQRVCDEFAPELTDMQVVNLHGDAHLEQYAVTNESFGLADFDRSGFGPAVIDLVRFAASVHVACAATAIPCDPEAAVAAFLDAYRTGVQVPDQEPVAPAVARRLRESSPRDQVAFLDWATKLMVPVEDAALDASVRSRWSELYEMLRKTSDDWSLGDLAIVAYGSFGLGIGSALDQKFLVRAAGPSGARDDDVVFELRAVKTERASCVYRDTLGAMFLHVLPASRIARERPLVLAYVPRSQASPNDVHWWVRSWDAGYRELELSEVRSQAELLEVVADVGLQLGRGHCVEIADPLVVQFRGAHLRWFDATRARVAESARRNAAGVIAAWKAYRSSG